MAKLVDLQAYNSSRKIETYKRENEKTLSFTNKDGNTVVITPDDLRTSIEEFINDEIKLYSNETIRKHRENVETIINIKLKTFENDVTEHMNKKINSIIEKIIENNSSRLIEEEVSRRVDAKLQQIKKAIDDSI